MKGKEIYRSTRKFGYRISEYSAQVAAGFDVECIHDLRTSVKKARALLRWAGKGRQKLTEGCKCLYSIAGEIRNAQLLSARLNESGLRPGGLIVWLDLHIALLEGQWSCVYRASTLRRLRKRIKRFRFKEVDKEGLEEWLSGKRGEVRMLLLDPTLPDEQLHEVRKIYKDMQFVLEWHGKAAADGSRREYLEAVKRIGSLAGEFNDKKVDLSLLYMYQEEWHAGSDEETRKIIQDWEKDKKEKRSALLALLDEHVHIRS